MNSLYKKLSWILPLAFLFCLKTEAQENVTLINLEKVLELGGANNLTILEYQQRKELALADIHKQKEWWLPDLYAGINLHSLRGKVMNGDGRFFTDVERENFWAGLGFNLNWNFRKGIFNKKVAELKAQALNYEGQVEKNNALLISIESYYDFLLAQLNYELYAQLLEQSDTIARQLQTKADAGLEYQSEVLLAKSNVNHLKIEMLNMRTSYFEQSSKLVGLLNLEPSIVLLCSDSLLASIELVNIDSLDYETAFNKHPGFKHIDLMSDALQKEKKMTTTGWLLPEIQLGGYTSVFGDVFNPVDPTSTLNGGLMWRVPLGRIFYGGELQQVENKLLMQQLYTNQLKNKLNAEALAAKEQIILAKQQIDLAEEGSGYAQEALSQSLERQKLGTVRPFEVLQAQEIFIKARLDYLKAVTQHNKAQYRLWVVIGNDL